MVGAYRASSRSKTDGAGAPRGICEHACAQGICDHRPTKSPMRDSDRRLVRRCPVPTRPNGAEGPPHEGVARLSLLLAVAALALLPVGMLSGSAAPAGVPPAAAIAYGATAALPPAATPQWHQLTNLTTAPSARDRFGLAYDPALNETVLFGGYNPGSASVIFGDTWAFRNGAWTQLAPSSAPAPRSGFVLTYDPSLHGILLFGGEDFSVHYGDTWLFNGSGWHQLNSTLSPLARSQYAIAYDGAAHAVVLFGGSDGSRDLSDTWEFLTTGWHRVLGTPHPAGRQFSEMAFDPSDHEVILTGGLNASVGAERGTWAFAGGVWTKLAVTPNPPSEVQSEATTVPGTGALYFGGQASGGSLMTNATWVFHLGTWTHTTYASAPGARKAGGFAYDSGGHYTLMFGGAATSVWLGDTWELY